MYRQYSFLLVLPLIFTFSVLFFLYYSKGAGSPKNQKAVNTLLGDKSYLHTFGEYLTEKVPEQVRIKTHLQYVESILRSRSVDHLTKEQQRNRFTHLKHLREYYQAGNFPHNDGHPDARRPTFISRDGNICAVGYLIEQSLGRDIVERMNQDYKYHFIKDIDAPVFKEWVRSSGFTIRELTMIQPMYEPRVVEEVERNENSIDLSYGLASALLTSSNVLYHTNNPSAPWMFNDASSIHWFGLAAGSGSMLIGALNLDNKRSFTEPVGGQNNICAGCFGPPLRKVTLTNQTRKTLSIANIGVGLISAVRAGYHLAKGTSKREVSTSIGVTQLEANPINGTERVPALEMRVRF